MEVSKKLKLPGTWTKKVGTALRERGGICLGMTPNTLSVDQKLGPSKSKCLEIEGSGAGRIF